MTILEWGLLWIMISFWSAAAYSYGAMVASRKHHHDLQALLRGADKTNAVVMCSVWIQYDKETGEITSCDIPENCLN